MQTSNNRSQGGKYNSLKLWVIKARTNLKKLSNVEIYFQVVNWALHVYEKYVILTWALSSGELNTQ